MRWRRGMVLGMLAACTMVVGGCSGDASEVGAQPVAATGTAGGGEEGFERERRTMEQTRSLLDAFERRDIDTVASLMVDETTLVQPYSFDGTPEPAVEFVGKEQVLGYFRQVFAAMGQIAFVDRRISVADDGATSFVQANGNFTTATGDPYRNVYVFRLDWRDAKIVGGEEYANPVAFATTFGLPLG